MPKCMRNNVKLFVIVSIMAGVLVFSPVLSTFALAESAEAAGTNATTEATTTTEAATTTEATSTTESAATTESTDTAVTTESTAPAASTDDDSDAEAVKSYIDNNYFGLTRELHISVSTDGGTYNGKSYIPPTISDDGQSVSFSSHVQREGYTLVSSRRCNS